MNSSNSFNICPRCGNSNSLNAKYCSRCGAQLKVPTEAVVCHKCHTRNSSLANFCRNCGATLKVGAQTKICPRCGREIGAEENMCACGYSFVNRQQAEPRRADVSSTVKEKRRDKKREKNNVAEPSYVESNSGQEKQPKQKKGGRGFAIFALILIAAFIYVIISPTTLRGPLGRLDKGYFYNPNVDYGADSGDKDVVAVTTTDEEGVESTVYVKYYSGVSLIKDVFDLLFEKESNIDNAESLEDLANAMPTMFDFYKIANSDPENPVSKFDFFKQMYGWGTVMMLGMIALFLFTSLLHVISCIIRIISPRRSKRGNWLYLALAIITTLLSGATMICAHFFAASEGFLATVYSFLIPGITVGEGLVNYFWTGFAVAYVPVAYWLLWLYSCIAKKASKKEKKSKKNA